jgi:hypothetical protein
MIFQTERIEEGTSLHLLRERGSCWNPVVLGHVTLCDVRRTLCRVETLFMLFSKLLRHLTAMNTEHSARVQCDWTDWTPLQVLDGVEGAKVRGTETPSNLVEVY